MKHESINQNQVYWSRLVVHTMNLVLADGISSTSLVTTNKLQYASQNQINPTDDSFAAGDYNRLVHYTYHWDERKTATIVR